jgi:hypothetical protein
MPSREMTRHTSRVRVDNRRSGAWTVAIGMLTALAGCAAATPEISPPRPIIIHSGARLRVDHERMTTVNEWVMREQENIVEDPSFMVSTPMSLEDVYVWDNLKIQADTVTSPVNASAMDSRLVHEIYAHLHLMVDMGRQDEWLPEAPEAVGYELERAILQRVSDAWLLGRTVFDVSPYGPLDELMYSNEEGFLDAFVFTARPTEFALARTEWARANPGATDRYRDWFQQTFNIDPPGLR